jgi:hypothetical protein
VRIANVRREEFDIPPSGFLAEIGNERGHGITAR